MGTLGYDPVTITGMCSAFGQIGVALVIMLKTKNKKLKSVSASAVISGLFGITEPAIYGITLQNKTAFILASIASGIGAAGVKAYTMESNGISAWIQTINRATGIDGIVIASIIGCVVSFVVVIVLMSTVGKKLIE